jgi:type I restriction enzyme S subunit
MSKLLEQINSSKKELVKLSDVAVVVPGFAFKSKDFSDDGIALVKITEIQSPYVVLDRCSRVDTTKYDSKKLKKYFLNEGEFVIAMTGATIGKVGKVITNEPLLLNQRVAVVRPKPDFSREFIESKLTSLSFQAYINSIASSSSAQANISGDDIGDFEFSLPDLPTQKKISEILSVYDAKIENNNIIIKNLEATAQTIFHEWFVNFKFPGCEKVKMADSEMRKTPDGWEVKKLDEILELAYGKALKEENRKSGSIPVVGSSGIVGFHNERLVSGPGIVVGRKGNAGSIIWVDDDFFPIDTTFYVKTKLPLSYIYFLLTQEKFINSDSAVPGLGRDGAYMRSVLVADQYIIEEFDCYAKSIFDKRKHLKKENISLKSQRDLLLAKLI